MVWGAWDQRAAAQDLQEPGAKGLAGGELEGLLLALLPVDPSVGGEPPTAGPPRPWGGLPVRKDWLMPESLLSLSCFSTAQCDGRPIPLPSLQGIAVLNIPSYAGGTNFWGGTKEDDVRSGVLSSMGLSLGAEGPVTREAAPSRSISHLGP